MFKSTERSVLLCQQLINFQSGEGASSGSGDASLNIFTQSTEPEKKDGIWIKTSNQYEKIITDARILNDDNSVWENLNTNRVQVEFVCSYNNLIYLICRNCIYTYNISNGTITNTGTSITSFTIHALQYNNLIYYIADGDNTTDSNGYITGYFYEFNLNTLTKTLIKQIDLGRSGNYYYSTGYSFVNTLFMYNNSIYANTTKRENTGGEVIIVVIVNFACAYMEMVRIYQHFIQIKHCFLLLYIMGKYIHFQQI